MVLPISIDSPIEVPSQDSPIADSLKPDSGLPTSLDSRADMLSSDSNVVDSLYPDVGVSTGSDATLDLIPNVSADTAVDSLVCDNPIVEPCRSATNAVCFKLGIEQCSTNPYCAVLRAQRVNTAAHCLSSVQEKVACGLLGCQAMETYAKDLSGIIWHFGSLCIPDGWATTSTSSAGVTGDCPLDGGTN